MENGNWQMTKKSNLKFFDWMNEHPRECASFQNHMKGYALGRGTWLDIYPLGTLLENANPEGVLFVDIGGSMGGS